MCEECKKMERQLESIQADVRYNTKLIESLMDMIPSKKINTDAQKLMKAQMGAIRPLFEKLQFDGKDQLLSMLDNMFGGNV